MKYSHERDTAKNLIKNGEMTISDVVNAAGSYRQLVIQWARGCSFSARTHYLERAWKNTIMSGELPDGTPDQDIALAIIRAGLALPIELAPLVGRDAQTVRVWARDAGIDAKATRRAFCLTRWREALAAEKQAAIDKEMERRAWWAATPEQREESGMEIPDGNMIVGGHAIPLREWYKQNKG